jgi:hypothetical protein
MKAKIVMLAVILSMSTMHYAIGKDAPELAVVAVKGSDVFKVIYKGAAAGRVKVNIIDFRNKAVLSETITGLDGFIFPVNFKGLPAGDYTIELIDGAGRKSEKVFYQPLSEMKKIHISKVRGSDGRFLLSIANSQKELIFVNIFDSGSNLIYTDSRFISGDFAQVYKIEKAGAYTFQVSDINGVVKSFHL